MSTTPVNVQIPSDPQAPVIADFVEHALRVGYVDRPSLSAMPSDDWDSPGVYILPTGDGSGQAYVGQARRLRSRLVQHNAAPRIPWTRAIAVKRDTTNGFNTAEIGYLEGRLAAEIGALAGVTVIEGKKSGDETLPEHMMISLDAFVKSILASLRLTGIAIVRGAEDEDSEVARGDETTKQPRASFNAKLSDLVSSGLIRAGVSVHLRQGRTTASGTLTTDGEILVNGVTYASPSAAAAKALNLQSSNGWTTWHVGSLDGPTLDQLRRTWLAQHGAMYDATPV